MILLFFIIGIILGIFWGMLLLNELLYEDNVISENTHKYLSDIFNILKSMFNGRKIK